MAKRRNGTTMVFRGKAALAVLNALSGREVVTAPKGAMCRQHDYHEIDCPDCRRVARESSPQKGPAQ